MNNAILLITHKRLKETEDVLYQIQLAMPKKLYIFNDKTKDSNIDNNNVRELINYYKEKLKKLHKTKVKVLFTKRNLGCRKGVETAINWFFENEKQGIILEDDCLPNQDFFIFCDKLLNKYKDNKKIMQINGTNYQHCGGYNMETDYYFSQHSPIWGWATWKRAWELNKQTKENNNIDTWDLKWQKTILNNKGITISPNRNLVKNIGFNDKSTHTDKERYFIKTMELEDLKIEKEPTTLRTNTEADKFYSERWFGNNLIFKIKDRINNILEVKKRNQVFCEECGLTDKQHDKYYCQGRW